MKKTNKAKVFAVTLSLIIILALSATAFAEGPKGSPQMDRMQSGQQMNAPPAPRREASVRTAASSPLRSPKGKNRPSTVSSRRKSPKARKAERPLRTVKTVSARTVRCRAATGIR